MHGVSGHKRVWIPKHTNIINIVMDFKSIFTFHHMGVFFICPRPYHKSREDRRDRVEFDLWSLGERLGGANLLEGGKQSYGVWDRE